MWGVDLDTCTDKTILLNKSLTPHGVGLLCLYTFNPLIVKGMGHPLGNIPYAQEYSHVKADAQEIVAGEEEEGCG